MKFNALLAVFAAILFIGASVFAFFIFPNYLYFAPNMTEVKKADIYKWSIEDIINGARNLDPNTLQSQGWDNFSGMSVTEFIGFELGKNERVAHNKIVRDGGELIPNTEFYVHITPFAKDMRFTRVDAGYFALPWHIGKDQQIPIGIVKNDGTPEGEEFIIDVGYYNVVGETELFGEKCWIWHYVALNKQINYYGKTVLADINITYWYSEKYQIVVKADNHLRIKMRYSDFVSTVAEEEEIPFVGEITGPIQDLINPYYPIDDATLFPVYDFRYVIKEESTKEILEKGEISYLAENLIVPGVSYLAAAIPIIIALIVQHKKSKKSKATQAKEDQADQQNKQ